jgi:uncharacterized membrane protein YjgN (DUF898 family)
VSETLLVPDPADIPEPVPVRGIFDEPVGALQPSPLVFTGRYGEYFRIWLVNLALSVITLGFYSPWAKVRRLEYFWRNTRLDGASFDYHGAPIAILRGRIVGAILFAAYSLTTKAGLFFHLAAIAAIAAIMPLLLHGTLRFRLHNTSYRGLRFRFTGGLRDAYVAFLGWPVLSVFSLFTLAPLAHQKMKSYEHRFATYGKTEFSENIRPGPFYGAYLAVFFGTMGAFMVVGMALGMIAAMSGLAQQAGGPKGPPPSAPPVPPAWLLVVILVMYLLAILGSQSFLRSRITNAVWNATKLGSHRFIATVQARRLLWLIFSNVVATVCTLGLFTPIAQIRMARYIVSAFVVEPASSFDDVAAADPETVGAIGEEASGLFDFDISF